MNRHKNLNKALVVLNRGYESIDLPKMDLPQSMVIAHSNACNLFFGLRIPSSLQTEARLLECQLWINQSMQSLRQRQYGRNRWENPITEQFRRGRSRCHRRL